MKHRPDQFDGHAQKSDDFIRLECSDGNESGYDPLKPERAPIFTPVFIVELCILAVAAFLIGKIPSPGTFIGLLAVFTVVHFFIIPKFMR